MQKKKGLRLFILYLFVLILLSSIALALPASINRGLEMFISITRNATILYSMFFILFFITFYGIYSGALGKLKIFGGDDGLNKSGKLVAVGFTGLTTFGMFWAGRKYSVEEFVTKLPEPFIVAGAAGLALLIFAVFYFGLRDQLGDRWWRYCIACIGFSLVVFGAYVNRDWIVFWGWFIVALSLLLGVLFGALMDRLGGGGGGGGRDGEPERERPERERPERERPERPARLRKPGQVQPFRGRHRGAWVDLWWGDRPEQEAVNYYEVYRRSKGSQRWINRVTNGDLTWAGASTGVAGAAAGAWSGGTSLAAAGAALGPLGIFLGGAIGGLGGGLMGGGAATYVGNTVARRIPGIRRMRSLGNPWVGGWRRVAYVAGGYTEDNPMRDQEAFLNDDDRVIRTMGRPWGSLEPVSPDDDYQYKIRAQNGRGKGPWAYLKVSRPGGGPGQQGWTPIVDNINQAGQTMEGHVYNGR